MAIKPHPAMRNTLPKEVANREEVWSAHKGLTHRDVNRATRQGLAHRLLSRAHDGLTDSGLRVEHLPLVAFTLLGQAAAGMAVLSSFAGPPGVPMLVTLGLLIAVAALASLFHLGHASRAWRTPANAGRSALSREVVALGLFAAAWLHAWFVPDWGRMTLALAGMALVHAMAEVYAIDAVPGWARWRTRAAFFASALLLGLVALLAVARPIPLWLVAIVAAGVVADQVARRWRFYAALDSKVM
jgi:DMSO reductase anchor subunit